MLLLEEILNLEGVFFMTVERISLHKLIDILPDNEIIVALQFLHFLANQFAKIPDDLQAEIEILQSKETFHESFEKLKIHLSSQEN